MFAAETGCIEELFSCYRPVDVMANENRGPEMTKINPDGAVPFIQLANGTVIAETIAICQYLEDSGIAKSKLFGEGAQERAEITMWQRRCDQTICLPCFTGFRSGMARDLFKDRGVHSFLLPEQSPLAKAQARAQCEWINNLKKGSDDEFICAGKLTIVDVQLFAVLSFIKTFAALGEPPHAEILDGLDWMEAWFSRMQARDSATAWQSQKDQMPGRKPAGCCGC